MNYLSEISAFSVWKEVNLIPATAIALWHELMSINDRLGWSEEFTVPSELLQIKAGLSRKQFETARLLLIQKGRIQYRRSKRANQAGIYHIIAFSIVQNGQREGQQTVQQTVQRNEHRRYNETSTGGATNGTSYYLNKNKDKDKDYREREITRARASKSDSEICAYVSQIYLDEHFRPPMNFQVADEIQQMCDRYPATWIRDALTETQRRNVKSLRYTETVLESYQRQGFSPSEEVGHGSDQSNRTSPARQVYQSGKRAETTRQKIVVPDWEPPAEVSEMP